MWFEPSGGLLRVMLPSPLPSGIFSPACVRRSTPKEEELQRRQKLLDESANIYQRFLDSVGVEELPSMDHRDIRDLRQQAYVTRALQKGNVDG